LDRARPDLSEIAAREAVELAPESPRARLALSNALLAQGRWIEAWPGYEHRLTLPIPAADFQVPRWRGEPLTGRRILVVGDQGLGDHIQFARYGALLKDQGALEVIFAVARPLARLLARIAGVDRVIEAIADAKDVDVWAPLMSLPAHFGTRPETIRATLTGGLPYISLDAPQRLTPRETETPLQVGVFWAGGHETLPALLNRADGQRSLSLDQILPLLLAPELDGRVQWTLLQKDRRPSYLAELARRTGWSDPFGAKAGSAPEDLLDTASIIAGLDLVIGVDSALIHLSAALGRPTWMMDRLAHCWRWRPGATDSDWYPGVFRIFRQTRLGDWTNVLAAVRGALAARAGVDPAGQGGRPPRSP
jgi:hypothetical protein